MIKIGRKNVLLISLLLVSVSVILLAPIEYLEANDLIAISIISRVAAGCSAGIAMTAADSIMISDYPDNVQAMIGRMEVAIGAGITLGPIVGIFLSLFELLYSLMAYGIFMILIIPICSLLLGTFRDYEIKYQINIRSTLFTNQKLKKIKWKKFI